MSKGRATRVGTAFDFCGPIYLEALKNRDDRFVCPTADQTSPQPGRLSCE